ncbi:hypothetical protein [Myroides phaeus]|uniref:Uncharacterized protein n=1 Tax=Myroides phaeus TaxID=702745 RepID=A0A1G8F4X9_9FLAO|nr:hypothetical protein [Myroides phaeus]MEC4117383.1 hypothetical protein [Myroides phaeus]SDH77185.1 hypothetical protein SAMN05421818_11454 [Myroides phaeus]
MSVLVVFFVVVLVVFFIFRQFVSIKRIKSKEEYLEYKQKQKELLEQEEEEWDDELMDKKSFDFLFIGAVATILFLVFGLFTGNSFYFILVLFIITAALYIYYLPPKDKF